MSMGIRKPVQILWDVWGKGSEIKPLSMIPLGHSDAEAQEAFDFGCHVLNTLIRHRILNYWPELLANPTHQTRFGPLASPLLELTTQFRRPNMNYAFFYAALAERFPGKAVFHERCVELVKNEKAEHYAIHTSPISTDDFIRGLMTFLNFKDDHPDNLDRALACFRKNEIALTYVDTMAVRAHETTQTLGQALTTGEMFQISSQGFSQITTPAGSSYLASVYNCVTTLLQKEKSSPSQTLDNILTPLATWRKTFSIDTHEMASVDRHSNDICSALKSPTLFGLRRNYTSPGNILDSHLWNTPLTDRYAAYSPRALAYRAAHPDPSIMLPGTSRRISLTRILDDQDSATLHHTLIGDSERIVHYVDNVLYKRLLEPGLDKALVIDTVAEMHWWMAHAMPYYRGSAAITDALTKVLLMKHEIIPGKWKTGVIPDLEAFVATREEYVNRYRSFFE